MLYKSKDTVVIHQNSSSCEVKEFGNIRSIDAADIEINGRYPEEGFSLNSESSFVIRVLGGVGVIAVEGDTVGLAVGDVAFVENGEPYYFEGQGLRLFMASTPAWNPEQYSIVE